MLDAWPLSATTWKRRSDRGQGPPRGRAEKLTGGLGAVQDDAGASAVLVAVVREFDAKLSKAEFKASDEHGSDGAVREGSSRPSRWRTAPRPRPMAAFGEEARQAVLDAHYAMCVLKAEM